MNIRFLMIAFCLAGLANPRTGIAQSAKSDPSQMLTQYLEPTTIAVVDINIEAIDLNATIPWFCQMTGTKPDATVTGMATAVVASFRSAGVKHMYLIVGTQSFQASVPLMVIPCQQPKNIEPFLAMFVQNFPPDAKLTTRLTDDVAMVGSLETFNRLAIATPTPRPDLLEPLSPSFVQVDADKSGKATPPFANSHVKVVMSLAADPRKQLITFWPEQLTFNENLSVSPKQLVQDIDRVIARVSVPPTEGIQVQIQTTSVAAADRTKQMIDNFSAIDPEVGDHVKRTVNDKVVTLFASAESLEETLAKLTRQARTEATVSTRMNSLKQLGLAIHNYADAYQELPPRVFVDPAGKPLFGWTVALLPYLEQQALYNELKLDQRWDSEANRKFTEMLIQVFGNDAASGRRPLSVHRSIPVRYGKGKVRREGLLTSRTVLRIRLR